MPNVIGRLAVPNQDGPAAVWVESLHEMAQVKDQWLTEPTRSVMTQPFRLEFVWAQGVRSRVPDFVADLSTGERVLVDVTSARVLKDPQRAAAFALTGVWARSVGMRYELRMEMPRQRERNLSFLWCHFGQHGRPDPEFLDVVGPRCPLTVKAAAKALGGGPQALLRIWEAVARQDVVVDLDSRIDPWTVLSAATSPPSEKPWVVAQ